MRGLYGIPLSDLMVVVGLAFGMLFTGCGREKADERPVPLHQKTDRHAFMVLDPGHFHASLVFKRTGYEGVSPLSSIYAPVGEDVTDHLARVVPFNNRPENPAGWQYRMYLGPDFMDVMLREKPGDIAIISGRNNEKIDRILACVDAGVNVLGDKPWLIDPGKFHLLESVLNRAEEQGLIAYDIMTERYEITSIIQRLIVGEEAVFGTIAAGTPDDPAVVKSSVHHLFKYVAGHPLKRPWWFFDTSVQGEGLVDITTHLVDLVFWILYPNQAVDYPKDIEMVSARHWPTVLSADQYETITGKAEFPPQFALDTDNRYPYYCNGQVNFRLRGVNVRAEVVWNYRAPEGAGDTHYSIIKGSRAHVLVLQGKEQNYLPEMYVQPAPGVEREELKNALSSFVANLASDEYPGISVADAGDKGWHIQIPGTYRVGHEAHFGQVTDRFLEYLAGEPLPTWERANMLAKYFVTTQALEMCRGE